MTDGPLPKARLFRDSIAGSRKDDFYSHGKIDSQGIKVLHYDLSTISSISHTDMLSLLAHSHYVVYLSSSYINQPLNITGTAIFQKSLTNGPPSTSKVKNELCSNDTSVRLAI